MGIVDSLRRLLGWGEPAPESDDEPPTDSDTAPGDGGPTVASAIGDGPGDFRDEAGEFVDFWGDLDFGPDSLQRLDELAAQQGERANYLTVEHEDGGTVSFAPIATGMACYFGEVLARNYDGAEWTRHEEMGWAVEVAGPDEAATVNVFHVAHDCLEEEPKFAFTHDVVLEETGVAGASVAGAGGT